MNLDFGIHLWRMEKMKISFLTRSTPLVWLCFGFSVAGLVCVELFVIMVIELMLMFLIGH